MNRWLERTAAVEDNGGPAGRCIARTELRRFETSTECVLEARRRRTYNREDAAGSVVLTASERDRNLLRPALHFLANHSMALFVDVREVGIPDEGSTEYAHWLRECLTRDRKLVLVATQEGLAAPWVPWQLGVAEGMLGRRNVGVLPVEEYGRFRGNPLLELYPVIRCRQTTWTLVGPGDAVGPALGEWLVS